MREEEKREVKKQQGRVYNKKWRENNPEKYAKYKNGYLKEYYLKNKDKIIKRVKKWTSRNKEKIKSYRRKYYKENKERIDERNKKYRQKNKDLINAKRKEKYQRKKKEGFVKTF